jgi:hypothetical protein
MTNGRRYAVALGISIFLLCRGVFNPSRRGSTASDIFHIRFGASDPRVLIYDYVDGFIGNVLIANSPQIILSAIYYSYNGLFTTFLLSNELNQFAATRKGLRVSIRPEQSQRSTYFLQLPYRYGIPLMVFSGVLHWLCSQSLFLVSVWNHPSTVQRNYKIYPVPKQQLRAIHH